MAASPVNVYLKEIEKQSATGKATEHTHRPALQALLQSHKKGVLATNEPARIACGAPDYIVADKAGTIGYVEAKDIGANLDEVERSPQLKRYLEALPNLILTDYLEFRLYHAGQLISEVRLGRWNAGEKLRLNQNAEKQLAEFFEFFFNAPFPAAATPTELAQRMAATARMLREIIEKAFQQEQRSDTLHGQLEAFQRVLLHDLTEAQFSDMYAQTICYGLFAARCNHKESRGEFKRQDAVYDLPETNPFLRQMFGHIAGHELDTRLSWAVDHLAQFLDRADMAAVLKDFGKRTRQEDPVVHFYETFLKAYDPRMREARGVYYTPEPVVSYIVRSVDLILKRDFGIAEGLASREKITVPLPEGEKKRGGKKTTELHKVLILDPATGTGTFLHGVIDLVQDAVVSKLGKGAWSGYVSQHLLPRLFGFELLMAPYAVAHMKLGIQLAESGYQFKEGERLGVYLTNTLEEAFEHEQYLPFAQAIADEANAASKVKKHHPVMVVLGNPPYSGASVNMNTYTDNLLKTKIDCGSGAQSYYVVDDKPLAEKKVWLQDDYVKFFRFAQARIERTGYGILAFVSNHGYLDNPTFRGMRQSLMQTFDKIYVLDLHGNSRKRETAPDGSLDQNVFDILQGVAIGIFIKTTAKSSNCQVQRSDLWGLRGARSSEKKNTTEKYRSKYERLSSDDCISTDWRRIQPVSPYYFFTSGQGAFQDEFNGLHNVAQIFPVNSTGVLTARDNLATDINEEMLADRIAQLRDDSISTSDLRHIFFSKRDSVRPKGDTDVWSFSIARKKLRNDSRWLRNIRPFLYRPFDKRYVYYSSDIVHRTRYEVMQHMLHTTNLGLITTRITKDPWDALCTRDIAAHKSLSAYDITYLFPLYLYPPSPEDTNDIEAFAAREEAAHYGQRRRANLDSEFIKDLAGRVKLAWVEDGTGDLKKTFGPEDVFHYIYAVFHSPGYRTRYAEFLKMDFPRVPLTSQRKLFVALCGLGKRLAQLHLLEAANGNGASFPVAGDNAVSAPRYVDTQQRVYINDTQYFEGVSPAVWEFHVGGYQVCHKWLKDRKARTLSFDEVATYIQIVAALGETISLMQEVDAAIDAAGGWPLQ